MSIGEILTAIPPQALETIPIEIRQEILEQIGRVELLDLFRLAPIDQLQWYANKLLTDLTTIRVNPFQPQPLIPVPTIVPLDAPALQRMGNLLCYGNNLGKGNWSRTILREVLDTKLSDGVKTCCLGSANQQKWAVILKETYGSETSAWTSADLVGIGDLLISLPPEDLNRISTEGLAKALNPILQQFGYITPLDMIGESRTVPFIKACVDSLGAEGPAFLSSYKTLMRKLVEASQWMVNSMKTVDQVLSDGISFIYLFIEAKCGPHASYVIRRIL